MKMWASGGAAAIRAGTRLGLVRVARGCRRAPVWTLLVVPVFALSQQSLPPEDLHREWLSIQAAKDVRIKKTWWQDLELERLTRFLEAGVDVNASDKRNWTPLHSAARFNRNPDIVTALIHAGARVDAADRSGDTPLHWAAADNPNAEIVSRLIEAGAPVNAVDRFGWLPIHTAADRTSNPEIIRTLLEAGSRRNERAYFLLFGPKFLLKHNSNMTDEDRKVAEELLRRVW